MTAPTIILLLTPTRLSVHHANRNKIELLAELSLDDIELAALQTLARYWRIANFHLLVDLAEEEFHFESVPQLSGADQRALFARKLDHSYRSTPYRRIAVRRGKNTNTLMLSALTRREPLDQVIDALLAEKCALVGIHSVALTCAELLRLDRPHLLLINRTEPGCWRQSYFTPEGLRFSRQDNPHAEEDSTRQAVHIAQDSRRARQYLSTVHALQRNDTLDVVLLTDTHDSPLLADAFKQALQAESPHIRASVEPVAVLATSLGFPYSCSHWETLLMLAIARGQVRDHYLPPAAGRYHRLRQLGRGIHWIAALIFGSGLLLGGQDYTEAKRLQATIEQTGHALSIEAADKHELDNKIRAISASEPSAMKEAVALYHRHLANWPDVEQTAQTLSQILSGFPLLTLERFTWQARPGTSIPAAQASNISIPATIDRRGQIIELAGRIDAFNGNYRAALEQISQLRAQLDKLPRTTTTLLNAPLDIRPQGSITPQENDMAHASFALRIVIAPLDGDAP